MDEATRAQLMALVVWGDPDEVGERLRDVLGRGVDGFTFSLPANGHLTDRVELLGQVGTAVLAGR
jgi:alkanesulfonate monooxygenase SsuD/methylene tetrahydromethanopterin reductase-like flavin-dependent oxidoreductase (luciferase family)